MISDQANMIERSAEVARSWVNELSGQLGVGDRQYAYRVLRAVLHALRDRLTVDAAASLSAQLPTLIRGIYFERWEPSKTPLAFHDVDAFLERVAREAKLAGETEASFAVAAVARLLRAHVSGGEIDSMLAVLPDGFRELIEV